MKLLYVTLILITLGVTSCSTPTKNNAKYKVTRIIDGDTFWAVDENLNGEKIRLIGLNTPELKGRNQEKEFYAEEAKKFLADLIYQKEIRLEFDVEHKDKYGRTLAYVYVFDTLFVNELLIAKGYAQKMRIPPNTKYASQFAAREQMAKARKIGIWQKP